MEKRGMSAQKGEMGREGEKHPMPDVLRKITGKKAEKIRAFVVSQGFESMSAFQEALRNGRADMEAGKEALQYMQELQDMTMVRESEKVREAIGDYFFEEAEENLQSFEGYPREYAELAEIVAKSRLEAGLPIDDLITSLTKAWNTLDENRNHAWEDLEDDDIEAAQIQNFIQSRIFLLKAWNGKINGEEIDEFIAHPSQSDAAYLESGVALLRVVDQERRKELFRNLFSRLTFFPPDENIHLIEETFDIFLELNETPLLEELLENLRLMDMDMDSFYKKLIAKDLASAFQIANRLKSISGLIQVGLAGKSLISYGAWNVLSQYDRSIFSPEQAANILRIIASLDDLENALSEGEEYELPAVLRLDTLVSILIDASTQGDLSQEIVEEFFARMNQLLPYIAKAERDSAIQAIARAMAAIGDNEKFEKILLKAKPKTKVYSYLDAALLAHKRGNDPESFIQSAKDIKNAETRFADEFSIAYARMGQVDEALEALRHVPGSSYVVPAIFQILQNSHKDEFLVKAKLLLQDSAFADKKKDLQEYIARIESELGNMKEAYRLSQSLNNPSLLSYIAQEVEKQAPVDVLVFDIWERQKTDIRHLLARMGQKDIGKNIAKSAARLGVGYMKSARKTETRP